MPETKKFPPINKTRDWQTVQQQQFQFNIFGLRNSITPTGIQNTTIEIQPSMNLDELVRVTFKVYWGGNKEVSVMVEDTFPSD